jgi:glycosyltransferase involved in cell wall biosynthesis
MKILHIYKDYYPVLGGMENHIKVLAESQVRRGHAVTVLVTHPTKITHVEMMNGVRVIKAGRLATIASTPISVSLPFLLSKERPDITHLHTPYPIGELSQFYFGKTRKVFLTYHSDVVRQKELLHFYKPFLKKVLSLADRIIVTSENYMKSSPHLREFMHKCTVIPLGIDLTPFLQNSSQDIGSIKEKYGSPIILFVGKLRYYKGLQFLLEAMSGIPAKLIVIGNGPMEKEWRNLASKLNINEKVFFLGEIGGEQLAHFYGASDIFVLPACERSEAFGLVQVEAMASGLSVISTELGTGTSFVNKHGETGLVVRPKDPDSLRVAILSLLDNPTLCLEMGRRGRERAMREFSIETMVERLLNLYEASNSA